MVEDLRGGGPWWPVGGLDPTGAETMSGDVLDVKNKQEMQCYPKNLEAPPNNPLKNHFTSTEEISRNE